MKCRKGEEIKEKIYYTETAKWREGKLSKSVIMNSFLCLSYRIYVSVNINVTIPRQEILVFYKSCIFRFSLSSKVHFNFIHISCRSLSLRAWSLELGSDSQSCGQSKVLSHMCKIYKSIKYIISHTRQYLPVLFCSKITILLRCTYNVLPGLWVKEWKTVYFHEVSWYVTWLW